MNLKKKKPELNKERLALLFENLMTTTIGYLVVGLTIAYILWPYSEHSLILSWLILLLLVTISRTTLLFLYRNNVQRFSEERWFQLFSILTIAAALVWGASSVLIFPENSTAFQVILLLLVAGLVAGAISTLAASTPLFMSFVIISLIPLSIRFYSINSDSSFTIGSIILFYTIIIVESGRKLNHNLIENIKLRIDGFQRESELKELNVQMVESEEKYRRLFELSDDPMWIIIKNKFMMANDSAWRLLGFNNSKELISTHPSEISPEFQEDGESSFTKANEMMNIAHQKGYHRFEWLHLKKNGSVFPVEVTLTRIPIEGEQALFCVWRDITAAKAAQKALSEALLSAEKLAQVKGQFLATMSHEIRTPLNGVLGIAQLLEGTELNEQQEKYVGTILSSGQTLLYIINDILDFSKIEAGEMHLDPVMFDLKKMLNEVIEILISSIQAKNLTFSMSFTEDSDVLFYADENRLRQVLFNLIGNAIKFTDKGSIKVDVSIGQESTETADVCIKIIDTGIGIDSVSQESLFEEFTQADASTTRTYGGTGLGLSICKRIVDLMGGSISVNSAIGKGSTFTLCFTLKKFNESAAVEDTTRSQEISINNSRINPDELEILLVEDNHVNQIIASKMIGLLGHKVSITEDGQQAVDICADKRFDLIFMDVQMPVMDGFMATEIIRNGEGESARTPIIALTANAMKSDKEKCLAVGMDDFLAKPIKQEQLADLILLWSNK